MTVPNKTERHYVHYNHPLMLFQVKQDCPEEDMHLASLHDAVIASLRHQLDETQQTLDFLRKSDHNLRLALRDAEQRAQEAETKLLKSTERYIYRQWNDSALNTNREKKGLLIELVRCSQFKCYYAWKKWFLCLERCPI